MFKKDVIDMVDINDLRDEGTLRSFLEHLDHWSLIDMLEVLIINHVFDISTDQGVREFYDMNANMSFLNLADSFGISQDQLMEHSLSGKGVSK